MHTFALLVWGNDPGMAWNEVSNLANNFELYI